MKTKFTRLLPLIVLCLVCANFAAGAPKSKPVADSKNITTEYFNVVLPQGWIMPEKISKKPQGMSAVFANKRTGMAVTVNVLTVPVSASDLANQTIKNMRSGGLKPGKAEKIGNLYRVKISGKASGEAWFGSNGQICAATVILGAKPDLKVANEFFAAFRPKDPNLFPALLR